MIDTKKESPNKKHISIILFLSLGILLGILFSIILIVSTPHIREFKTCIDGENFLFCFRNFIKYHLERIKGNCYKLSPGNYSIKESYSLPLNVYIITPINESQDKLNEYMNSFIEVWTSYGVEFYINSSKEVSLPENEFVVIMSGTDLGNFSERVIGESLYDNKSINLILTDRLRSKQKDFFFRDVYKKSNVEGRGLKELNDKKVNLAIVSTEVKNVTWDICHEFGHILGLVDNCYFTGKYNLMTHVGCIKDEYFPTSLNQVQVDEVLRTASIMNRTLKAG